MKNKSPGDSLKHGGQLRRRGQMVQAGRLGSINFAEWSICDPGSFATWPFSGPSVWVVASHFRTPVARVWRVRSKSCFCIALLGFKRARCRCCLRKYCATRRCSEILWRCIYDNRAESLRSRHGRSREQPDDREKKSSTGIVNIREAFLRFEIRHCFVKELIVFSN